MAGLKRTDQRGRILREGESQLQDGRYRYRYTDANGSRHDVYSKRLLPTDRSTGGKEELSLREKVKKIERDLADGIKATVENRETLNQLFHVYMAGKPELKESTRSNYFLTYNRYVRDTLGTRKIVGIKYSDVKSFYSHIVKDLGIKLSSLENIHIVINPVFKLAVRDGIIRINPAEDALKDVKRSFAWSKKRKKPLSIQEQSRLIDYVKHSDLYRPWLPLLTVLLGTGARIGEVIGLRWEDCDLEKRTITINHGLVYRRYYGEDHYRLHVTTPKTEDGIRVIPMLEEVRNAILQERETQEIVGFCDTVIDGYSGFLFHNRFGTPHTQKAVNDMIHRLQNQYNEEELALAEQEGRPPELIHNFSTHILRHTFCTRFCENESNIKAIQSIMGHADIKTTLEIYAEATEEKKQEVMQNLQGKIDLG